MKNNGSKSEEAFETMIETRFGLEAFLYRIADQKELSRGNKLKGVVTRKTPSDYILTLNGTMAYSEIKSCSNDTSFPFSQFTPGQNNAMVRQDKAGGLYWIWIHNLTTNSWYWITGRDILNARAQGKKSLKWDEIKSIAKGKI